MRNLSQSEDWQPASSVEVVEAINQRLQHPQRSKKVLWLGGLVAVWWGVFLGTGLSVGIGLFTIFCYFWTKSRDSRQRSISFTYEGTQPQLGQIAQLFEPLAQCQHLWEPYSRNTVQIRRGSLPGVACESQLTNLTNLRSTPYFAPDQLYLFDGKIYVAFAYENLQISHSIFQRKETAAIPTDAKIIGEQWLYQRKNGEPDRRRKNNQRVSNVEYGAVQIVAGQQTIFELACSNSTQSQRFAEALRLFLKRPSQPQPATNSVVEKPLPQPQPQHTSASPYSTDRFVEVLLSTSTVPQVTEGESIAIKDHTFIQEARERHRIQGFACSPVSFQQYWPTYSNLDDQQATWYFYWRGEIRRGNHLPTDTSYIFLHAYELINLVEKSNPIEAASQLRQLSFYYRNNGKSITNYLPEWSGDVIAAHIDLEMALDWWSEIITEGAFSNELFNILIQRAADKNKLATLPLAVWWRLTDFRPDKKMLLERGIADRVEQVYKRAIAIADDYWRVAKGQSLVEAFTESPHQPVNKSLFTSAIYGLPAKKTILLGSAKSFTDAPALSQFLKALFKQAENVVRSQLRYPLYRAVGILPDDFSHLLIYQLEKEFALPLAVSKTQVTASRTQTSKRTITNQPAISLDMARIKQAQKASESLAALLETKTESEPLPPQNHAPIVTAAMPAPIAASQPKPQASSVPVLKLDFDEIARLKHDSELASNLLNQFNEEQDEDERPITPPVQLITIEPETKDADLSPEDQWQLLIKDSTAAEVELLHSLANDGRLTDLQISSIAKKHKAMASALFDNLCERAVEVFGNSPIYQGDECYEVEESDLALLQIAIQ